MWLYTNTRTDTTTDTTTTSMPDTHVHCGIPTNTHTKPLYMTIHIGPTSTIGTDIAQNHSTHLPLRG